MARWSAADIRPLWLFSFLLRIAGAVAEHVRTRCRLCARIIIVVAKQWLVVKHGGGSIGFNPVLESKFFAGAIFASVALVDVAAVGRALPGWPCRLAGLGSGICKAVIDDAACLSGAATTASSS